MRKSITTRYFYSTAMLLLASIAIMGFIQIYLSMGYFRTTNDNTLIATVDNTVRILKDYTSALTGDDNQTPKTSDQFQAAADQLQLAREIMLTSRASGNSIYLADANGIVLMSNDGIEDTFLSNILTAKVSAAIEKDGVYTQLGTLSGFFSARHYIAVKPIVSSKGVTLGYVCAASDASSLNEYLANLFSTFILSAGLMLMVSSVLSIVLTTRMTTPLRRISDAAKQFGSGDFATRVPVEGDDEVAALALTFNNMASSLEKIDVSRRSFMGNIAHELRTPMTTVKGFVDGMLDDTIPPDSHPRYLGIVSQEVGRLTRLIQNMLDITKLEAGEYKVNATAYDIWETITSVMFANEQRIEEKHLHIAGFAPARTNVYADGDLVYQVVQNLLDNAIKFCPEDGTIQLGVSQSKNVVTVRIRNTGVGISADALPFIFDRFYKEDKSRGLNTMGSGLGLHICKVLVGLSGGTIWVNSKEGEFAEFCFTLPAEQLALPKTDLFKRDNGNG